MTRRKPDPMDEVIHVGYSTDDAIALGLEEPEESDSPRRDDWDAIARDCGGMDLDGPDDTWD